MNKVILITGGCGFIASNFILYLLDNTDYHIVNIDKMNYCSRTLDIKLVQDQSRYTFYKCDINNTEFVSFILEHHNVNIVYHFAAQTHVDNSFDDPNIFVQDNILGTCNLLYVCHKYNLNGRLDKFIHVSTDEVRGSFSDGYNPTNPYSASKASAELMAKSYLMSFKLPVIITRSNNVYGAGQYEEKVIPKFIKMLKQGKKCPVYGTGQSKRTYLYILDACKGYHLILEKGLVGQIYEMGTTDEFTTLELLTILENTFNLNESLSLGDSVDDKCEFVADRLYHDARYQVNTKSMLALGWQPEISFKEGIKKLFI